jgi:hypothetical protein
VEEAAAGLRRLAEDEALRARLAQAGQRRVQHLGMAACGEAALRAIGLAR